MRAERRTLERARSPARTQGKSTAQNLERRELSRHQESNAFVGWPIKVSPVQKVTPSFILSVVLLKKATYLHAVRFVQLTCR